MVHPLQPDSATDDAPIRDLTNALTEASAHEQLLRRRLDLGTATVDDRTRATLAGVEHGLRKAITALRDLQDA